MLVLLARIREYLAEISISISGCFVGNIWNLCQKISMLWLFRKMGFRFSLFLLSTGGIPA